MSRKYIILLIIAVVLILVGLLALRWVFKPAEASMASEKAAAEISAADLISAFETDEPKANESYLGKVILVTGTIDKIDEDSASVSVTLKQPESISGVICTFSKETVSENVFSAGKEIKVKGKCDGYLMDVILTKCSVAE
jgi:hypothetical protein